jgi:hypothetical protein
MTDDDDVARSLRGLFDDAIDLAHRVKAEIVAQPAVATKRGGPRLNPSFRVWDGAVQNACRLARLLGQGRVDRRSIDQELTELLEKEQQ